MNEFEDIGEPDTTSQTGRQTTWKTIEDKHPKSQTHMNWKTVEEWHQRAGHRQPDKKTNGGRYGDGTLMRHCKTACFEALVLEPQFDKILRLLLAALMTPWLCRVRCKHHIVGRYIAALSNTCGLHIILRPKQEWRIVRQLSLSPCKAHMSTTPVAKNDANFKYQK